MKIKTTLFLLFISSSLFCASETLEDALTSAYENNNQLKAEREELKAADEQVAKAISPFLPRAKASSSVSNTISRDSSMVNSTRYETHRNQGPNLVIEQNIFNGLKDTQGFAMAKKSVIASRAKYLLKEQEILLGAAKAYLTYIRAKEMRDIYKTRVESAKTILESAELKFKVGEAIKIDVAAAKSVYSRENANFISADSEFRSATENFLSIIGTEPISPKFPELSLKSKFTNFDEALTSATKNNPNLIYQRNVVQINEGKISQARGEFLPSVNAAYSVSKLSSKTEGVKQKKLDQTVQLEVSIPLFNGGYSSSDLREKKRQASSARLHLKNAEQQIRFNVSQYWEGFNQAQAAIISMNDALEAAKVAYEGRIEQEKAGIATTLDVIDAQNVYFDNQIKALETKINYFLSYYQLSMVTGNLTAEKLKLKTKYFDPTENYKKISGKFIGS